MWESFSLRNSIKTIINANSQNNGVGGLNWNPYFPTPIFFSIIVVTIIMTIIIFYYYFSIRKLKPNETPKGFALLLFILVNYAKQLVFEVLGPRFIKITPYFLMLFGYILLSNFVGIVGFENPTASVTVTLSMGFVTFIGTFVIGFKYQRLSYLKKFLLGFHITNKTTNKKTYIPLFVNPLEMIGGVTPLISISLRLWGNIFAGGIILALFYSIPMALSGVDPTKNEPNKLVLIMGLFAAPLNAYLDVMTGIVQALVFVLLTMVYWKMSMSESVEGEHEKENDYKFVDFENECCVKITNISTV